MKRETKLGLVLSGSFLCLLGALVGRKLLLGETPAAPDVKDAVVAQADPIPSKKGSDQKINEPKKLAGINQNTEIIPVGGVNSEHPPGQLLPALKTQPAIPDIAQPVSPGKPDLLNGAPGAVLPSLPPPAPVGTPVSGGKELTFEELLAQQKNASNNTNGKNPIKSGTGQPLPSAPPAPVIPEPKPGFPPTIDVVHNTPPTVPAPGAKVEPKVALPAPTVPEPALPLAPPLTLVKNDPQPPLPEPTAPAIPAPPVAPNALPETPPGTVDKNKTPVPVAPSLPDPSAKKPDAVPALPPVKDPLQPAPPLVGAPPTNVNDKGSANVNIEKPIQVNPGGLKPVPVPPVSPPDYSEQGMQNTKNAPGGNKSPALPSVPPVGVDPKAQVNPMKINSIPVVDGHNTPKAAPKVQVTDYFVETYHCQEDALTFPAISKKLYRTEKYAEALLLYNRAHPNNASSTIQQNPPVLKVSQPVYIPPTYILESQYPSAVKDIAPLQEVPVAVKPPVVAKTPGSPALPDATPGKVGGIPVKVTDDAGKGWPQQPPTTTTGPQYVIKGKSEMIYDIARLTLGDGKRWSEIYRLNPQVDPRYPLPPGTQLRLPPGAKAGN